MNDILTTLVLPVVVQGGYLVAGFFLGTVKFARRSYEQAWRDHPSLMEDADWRRQERAFGFALGLLLIPVWPIYRLWIAVFDGPVSEMIVPKTERERDLGNEELQRRIDTLEREKADWERWNR